jgi:uncharacterized protein (DUF1800 family)
MDDPALAAAIAANRFGLGARPGELARVGGDARGWLSAQLAGGAPLLQGAELRGSADILSQALELRREQRDARAASAAQNGDAAAVMKVTQLYKPIYADETSARISAALTTDRPFVERLTYFWTNHFAVSVDKAVVFGLAGSFEREAIRPHVLGNFTDLLLASTRHPAMLLYLDNQTSVGPNSLLARRAERRASERRSRVANARGRGRLHAGRRHELRAGHHRLVNRWTEPRAPRGWDARAVYVSPRDA